MTIIKLSLVVGIFLYIISEFAKAIFLPNFVLAHVDFSLFVHLLAIHIHKAIQEVSEIDRRNSTYKFDEPKTMFFISKKLTLINIFILSDLYTIPLPCDLLRWSLSQILTYIDSVIVVTNKDKVFNISDVIDYILLAFIILNIIDQL